MPVPAQGAFSRFASSSMGKFMGRSVAETAGFIFEKQGGKWASHGFLGLGTKGKFSPLAMLAPAGTVYAVYSGYKEHGITGAIASGATAIGTQAAFNVLGGPVVLGGLAIGGMGYAGYKFGEAATNYRKRLRKLEIGGGDIMNSIQGAATDRQRSMQALQGSPLNARMALGNEAQLLHTSYSGMSTFGR